MAVRLSPNFGGKTRWCLRIPQSWYGVLSNNTPPMASKQLGFQPNAMNLLKLGLSRGTKVQIFAHFGGNCFPNLGNAKPSRILAAVVIAARKVLSARDGLTGSEILFPIFGFGRMRAQEESRSSGEFDSCKRNGASGERLKVAAVAPLP